jgi:hypothetical protein
MGIHPHKERAVDALQIPVVADGLTDGQDMVLIEGVFQ